MTNSLPSVRTQLLADELLAAMQQKGWTCSQVAEKMQWSVSKVSRITNGARQPQEGDLGMLLAVLEVPITIREELLEFARSIGQTSWWQKHDVPTGTRRRITARLQSVATCIASYDADVVPPLLQVPDYVRALVGDQAPEQVKDEVAHQKRAWATLMKSKPALTFFIRERALIDAWIPPEAMCDQVHHLLRMAVIPDVTIRLVSESKSIRSYSSFLLQDFAYHPSVVRFPHCVASTFLEADDAISDYVDILNDLHNKALRRNETAEWLRQLAAKLSNTTNDEASLGMR